MPFPTSVDAIVDAPPITAATVIHASQVLGPQRITVGPTWFNVKSDQYGAVGDGSTDDTAAFQAAINAAVAVRGRVLVPPSATRYVIAGQLDFTAAGADGVELCGASPAANGGAGAASVLLFTGSTSPLIKASGRIGQRFSDLQLLFNNNAFVGTVLDLSTAQLPVVQGCYFGKGGNAPTAGLIIGMDNGAFAKIERCVFHNYTVSIQGVGTSGHTSQSVVVRDCLFSSLTGDAVTAHIQQPGAGWLVEGNNFEQGQALGNPVVIQLGLGSAKGLHFVGNWIGDHGANAVTVITAPSGSAIEGNFIGGKASSTAVSIPAGVNGVVVKGNYFDTHSVALLLASTASGWFYAGNFLNAVTTEISGSGAGGVSVNRHLLASGTAPGAAAGANAGTTPPAPVVTAGSSDIRGNITFGTGTTPAAGAMVAVTFASTYAAAPLGVILTWNNAAGAGLGQAYVTGVGTNGFTINCTTAPAASQANTTYAINYTVIG